MARARTTAKIKCSDIGSCANAGRNRRSFLSVDLSAFEEPAAPTRLWDLHPSLHCSIIGTCLTNAELRQILRKAGVSNADRLSDHGLHHEAVSLCSKRNAASKLVHKALDRKHRCTINQFNRAKSKDEVHALWRGFLEKGEIPGSYWAVLTHAHSDNELIQTVFAACTCSPSRGSGKPRGHPPAPRVGAGKRRHSGESTATAGAPSRRYCRTR